MDSLQIVILALVQGLTEFLPISSSAHLVLLPQILQWPGHGLVFDVAVHIGSLLAVLYYFRVEVRSMLRAWLRSLAGGEADQDSLLAWWVIIGTIAGGRSRFPLLQGPIEESLRSPWIVGAGVDRFRFGVVDGRCELATNPYRIRVKFKRRVDNWLLPGAVVHSGYLAFRHYHYAGTCCSA